MSVDRLIEALSATKKSPNADHGKYHQQAAWEAHQFIMRDTNSKPIDSPEAKAHPMHKFYTMHLEEMVKGMTKQHPKLKGNMTTKFK